MALLINNATPAGGDSPTAGDDQIRAFKLAVEDIFGIPDNTTITLAVMDVDAAGLAQVIFADPAVTPASGELGRSGSTLYYRITDARTATTTRPLGVIADTTGAPAASIGVGMLFQAESADEAPSDFGALDFVASDIGAGTEDTYLSVLFRVAGGALDEKYRFSSTAGSGFAALFTHAVTADRTYTLPDADTTFGAGKTIISFGTSDAIAAGQTRYAGHSSIMDATEDNVDVPVPFAFTAKNLYCKSNQAPGGGQTFTYTLRKNQAATALTAAISGAAAVTASDLVNTVSFVAGDQIALQLVASGGSAGTPIIGSIEVDPA